MCGIAGILDLRRRPIDPMLLRRMCDTLTHRGPDDEGFHIDHHVGLGQRRLSIIDLSTGRQPMSNEEESIWVTFNGEIYNFEGLRDRLVKHAHRFSTHSDTEVIVHAYEQFGVDCLPLFRGMFAFALWDGPTQTLLLARDRVGKKPLFYAEVGGQFMFASELQALLEHPDVRREPDPRAIDEYLSYSYIPAPRTIFRDVKKLLPAHYLTVRMPDNGDGAAETRMERYWSLNYTPKARIGENEAAEELVSILTEAVRLRMIADVPLGALLSGGIDSSLIVALMSGLSDRPVKTFSIGFDEQAFNELPYARAVAQRYATDHHELVVRATSLDILPALVRHYGEPFADSSAIPSYHVAHLTRQHVKVALNGDGGDESFAGYERYFGNSLADRFRQIPEPLRRRLIAPLVALIPGSLPRRHRLGRVKRFLDAAGDPAAEQYLRWMSNYGPEAKQRLYSPEFRARLGGDGDQEWLLGLLEQAGRDCQDPLDAVLAADVSSYLPYDLLVKMDIATMANSLEARSPFLDHEVMEFSARLPSSYKIRGLTQKYLLKKIARDLLPPEHIHRRKMGFGVPVGDWMRGDWRPTIEEALLGDRASRRGYFEQDEVRRLLHSHLSRESDHTYQLWALFWLELWHREFID